MNANNEEILNKLFVCGLRTSFSTFDFVSLFSILSEAHFNAPVSASALVSFPSSSSSSSSSSSEVYRNKT